MNIKGACYRSVVFAGSAGCLLGMAMVTSVMGQCASGGGGGMMGGSRAGAGMSMGGGGFSSASRKNEIHGRTHSTGKERRSDYLSICRNNIAVTSRFTPAARLSFRDS